MKKISGFSLIELLTVIAIIGLLAAIIFPVMGVARGKARQTQCTSNLNQIQQALALYKNDNRTYPPVIAGFAQPGVSLDNITDGFLFKEYVKGSVKVLHCPNATENDLNATVPDPLAGSDLIAVARPSGAQLYRYDSYAAQVLNYATNVVQPRYTLAWADEPQNVPNAPYINTPEIQKQVFQRQLKFRNPPDDTVVTWCSYHRGGTQDPSRGGHDLVLFLDGHVDRIPANQLQPPGSPWNYAYTVKPKP